LRELTKVIRDLGRHDRGEVCRRLVCRVPKRMLLPAADDRVGPGTAYDHATIAPQRELAAEHVEALLGALMHMHRDATGSRRRVPPQERVPAAGLAMQIRHAEAQQPDAVGVWLHAPSSYRVS